MKRGFTFIELLLVLICISILTCTVGFNYNRVRDSHLADTFLHEVTILRNALQGYWEVHRTFPPGVSELTDLTDSQFDAIALFWRPFHPDNSNVAKDSRWCCLLNSTDLTQVELQLQRDGACFPLSEQQIEKIQKKCSTSFSFEVDSTGHHCYIFKAPPEETGNTSNATPTP